MIIRCLIIDDEPSSQNVLIKFIADIDFLELCGICNNAIEALDYLKNNKIDLLFLDINMPKISGLTFYKSLQNPPCVIFTTAYTKYAIDGFEVNAIDYLLKPFSFDRFFAAINKVVDKQLVQENINSENNFILIKSNKTLHKIKANSVLYIEAFGDYVKIHLDDNYILTNSTFSNILELFPQTNFVRCHKSFAINLEKMESMSGNQIKIAKHNIPIGQTFKSEFLDFLNKHN